MRMPVRMHAPGKHVCAIAPALVHVFASISAEARVPAANRWGFEELRLANMAVFRSPSPSDLRDRTSKAKEQEHPRNTKHQDTRETKKHETPRNTKHQETRTTKKHDKARTVTNQETRKIQIHETPRNGGHGCADVLVRQCAPRAEFECARARVLGSRFDCLS